MTTVDILLVLILMYRIVKLRWEVRPRECIAVAEVIIHGRMTVIMFMWGCIKHSTKRAKLIFIDIMEQIVQVYPMEFEFLVVGIMAVMIVMLIMIVSVLVLVILGMPHESLFI